MHKKYEYIVRVVVEVESLETGDCDRRVVARGELDAHCALQQYEVDTDRGTKIEEEPEVLYTNYKWDDRTKKHSDHFAAAMNVGDTAESIAVSMTEEAFDDLDADDWDNDEEDC